MYSIVVYGTYKPWTNVMQLAQQVATGWMVQELNPRGSKSFCTHPNWPWDPPSLLYNG